MPGMKTLSVTALLLAAVALIVSLTAVPARDDARPPAAAPSRAVSGGDAMGRAEEAELERDSPGGLAAQGSRSPVPDLTASTERWSIAGHVRLGAQGSLPDAPLLVAVYAGLEAVGEPLTEARIRSDENGDFVWATVEPTETVTVHVIPELDGHKVYASTRVTILGDPPPSDLEPSAYLLDTLVTGRVLDGDGNGIADALLFSHLSEVRTDDDGHYVLPMDSGYRSPTFHVLAEGFACEQFAIGALRPDETKGPDVVLRRELAVEGRVIDAAGAPIAGATVSTFPFDRLQTTTSVDGSFRLGGLDPARKGTTVYARTEVLTAASQRVVPGSAAGTELEFVLTPGARLSGRVVTDEGQPVANAAVCFNGYPNSSGPGVTRTDESGAFELTGIRSQTNDLWARRRGWAADRIQLTISETEVERTNLELVLRPGFGLSGTLLDEADRPIAGAEIRPVVGRGSEYVGDSAHSDAQGRFVMQGLRKERFGVRVFATGFAPDEQHVQAGSDVILRARRAGGIAGLVVDGATGAPIDSFVVRFVPPRLEPGEHSMSRYGVGWSRAGVSFDGTDGVWDSSPETLAVGAVTGVEVSAPGYAPTVVEHVVVTSTPVPADLRIELHAGVTLRGIVTDATTGLPLRDARVRRFTEGDPHDTRRYLPDEERAARTDEHGRFQLERVPYGAMFLVVDQTDLPLYIDGPFGVASTATTLERAVAVSAGGRLVGRYLDGDGRPFANQSVTLVALEVPADERPRHTVETDAEGAFEFEHLSAGLYHLRGAVTRSGASAAVGAAQLELVQVEDGQTLELDLRPIGRATLTGTIEFDGELPDQVSVTLRPKQASGTWASRIVEAGVHDGAFSAPHLDAGEWTVGVFLQVDGEMVVGQARVQVPEEGTAQVHLSLRAMGG